MYAVRYNDFIPITIKALQEQQIQIDKLVKSNEELIKFNKTLIKRIKTLKK